MMGATMDPATSSAPPSGSAGPSPVRLAAAGVLLFLFIPLVLFLFVRHPAPIWLSLVAGVVLMIAHRRVARPYMRRVLPWKCVWCNRVLPRADAAGTAPGTAPGTELLELEAGKDVLYARCCTAHRDPAARFFTFLDTARWPLRAGIFVPLLLLLLALIATAAGQTVRLDAATALFQLIVGITVNVAALGYLFLRPRAPVSVPFPVHNFFLLGVRILLWIFRLVGIWWIWKGLSFFLR
jgi:hypothetical protein